MQSGGWRHNAQTRGGFEGFEEGILSIEEAWQSSMDAKLILLIIMDEERKEDAQMDREGGQNDDEELYHSTHFLQDV